MLSGLGEVTGVGLVEALASAGLSGLGDLSAAALLVVPGTAALSRTGVLAAAGLVEVLGAAALSSTGALTGVGLVRVLETAALSGTGDLTAVSPMTVQLEPKDPDAVVDYRIDWSDRLNGDTIAISTWTVPSGITKDSDTHDNTTTTIWLSGELIPSFPRSWQFRPAMPPLVTAGPSPPPPPLASHPRQI
jgi:hypothetical protein